MRDVTSSMHAIVCTYPIPFNSAYSLEVAVTVGHEVGEVDHSVGVAPLVVVPGHNLHEAGGQGDACVSVEDRGTRIRGEVLGHDCVLGVAKDTLEFSLGGSLDALLDFVVGGVLCESDGKVDD